MVPEEEKSYRVEESKKGYPAGAKIEEEERKRATAL